MASSAPVVPANEAMLARMQALINDPLIKEAQQKAVTGKAGEFTERQQIGIKFFYRWARNRPEAEMEERRKTYGFGVSYLALVVEILGLSGALTTLRPAAYPKDEYEAAVKILHRLFLHFADHQKSTEPLVELRNRLRASGTHDGKHAVDKKDAPTALAPAATAPAPARVVPAPAPTAPPPAVKDPIPEQPKAPAIGTPPDSGTTQPARPGAGPPPESGPARPVVGPPPEPGPAPTIELPPPDAGFPSSVSGVDPLGPKPSDSAVAPGGSSSTASGVVNPKTPDPLDSAPAPDGSFPDADLYTGAATYTDSDSDDGAPPLNTFVLRRFEGDRPLPRGLIPYMPSSARADFKQTEAVTSSTTTPTLGSKHRAAAAPESAAVDAELVAALEAFRFLDDTPSSSAATTSFSAATVVNSPKARPTAQPTHGVDMPPPDVTVESKAPAVPIAIRNDGKVSRPPRGIEEYKEVGRKVLELLLPDLLSTEHQQLHEYATTVGYLGHLTDTNPRLEAFSSRYTTQCAMDWLTVIDMHTTSYTLDTIMVEGERKRFVVSGAITVMDAKATPLSKQIKQKLGRWTLEQVSDVVKSCASLIQDCQLRFFLAEVFRERFYPLISDDTKLGLNKAYLDFAWITASVLALEEEDVQDMSIGINAASRLIDKACESVILEMTYKAVFRSWLGANPRDITRAQAFEVNADGGDPKADDLLDSNPEKKIITQLYVDKWLIEGPFVGGRAYLRVRHWPSEAFNPSWRYIARESELKDKAATAAASAPASASPSSSAAPVVGTKGLGTDRPSRPYTGGLTLAPGS